MKTVKTRKQKNSLLVRVCIFAFAAYVGVSLFSLHMEINSKQTQLKEVEAQIETQRLAQKELERQISLGDDETHLARIARDKLGMSFSDEHVYRDVSGS